MTIVFVASATFVFLAGGVVLAHANYVSSIPEADARLARPPSEVRVSFSEAVEAGFSGIDVFDTSGARVDRGEVRRLDEHTLAVGLSDLQEGGYTVVWRVLSAVDGHETRGSFVFAVGSAALPALPDLPATPPPSPREIAGRALSYAGVALLIGAPLFALAVARSPGERVGPLARAGSASLLIGTALLVLDQANPAQVLLDSRLGRLFEARAIVAVAGLAMGGPRTWLLYGGIAAASLTAQSHAAAAGSAPEVVYDFVHLAAGSAWGGGLVALAVVALPRFRAADARTARELGAIVWRFSVLGLGAVGLIVVTGILQSFARLVDIRDLIETPYGIAVLAKVVLLAAAVGIAAPNLLRHGPALRGGAANPARRRLLLGVRAEAIAVALILIAAAALTALVPPKNPTGAAYAAIAHAGGLRIELDVRNALPGQNRYVIRLQERLSPASDVERVAIRFTMEEHNMGEQELVARAREPGMYVAEGSPTSMFGTWRAQVIVRRIGREEVRAVFTIPVSVPAGTGATARLIQAGDITLVVFSDPVLPSAGQPVALSIVAIDPAGNPFQTSIAAVVEGVRYPAAPLEGARYRIDLPALGAGEKSAVLTIATPTGERTAEYRFTVQP